MECFYCKGQDPKKCKIKSELDILSDKWTLLILRLFFIGNKKFKFNGIKKELKPITSKILSEKLKKLVNCSYLTKKEYNEKSKKRVIYSATEKVNKLKLIISKFSEL